VAVTLVALALLLEGFLGGVFFMEWRRYYSNRFPTGGGSVTTTDSRSVD